MKVVGRLASILRRGKLDPVNLAVGALDLLLTYDLRLYIDILAAGVVGAGDKDSLSRVVVLLADETEASFGDVLARGNLDIARILLNPHREL